MKREAVHHRETQRCGGAAAALVAAAALAMACGGSGDRSEAVAAVTDTAAIKRALVDRHGPGQETRISRGVDQAAALWRVEDGDLGAFALEHFVADPQELDATLARLEETFEQVDGSMLALGRELRRATDLDLGPLLRIDPPPCSSGGVGVERVA